MMQVRFSLSPMAVSGQSYWRSLPLVRPPTAGSSQRILLRLPLGLSVYLGSEEHYEH